MADFYFLFFFSQKATNRQDVQGSIHKNNPFDSKH